VLIGVIASLIVVAVLLPARTAFGGRSLVPSGRQSAEVSRAAHDSVKTVIVQKGDTLWSIAKKLEPKKDPREVVDQLVDARGTSSIHVGEKITWSK
jgi:hypothetical protein